MYLMLTFLRAVDTISLVELDLLEVRSVWVYAQFFSTTRFLNLVSHHYSV